jgi:hypothetical protein
MTGDDRKFLERLADELNHSHLEWSDGYGVVMAKQLRTIAQHPDPQGEAVAHGLSEGGVATLLRESLKPEEIGGAPDLQQCRVRELLHWFVRFTRRMANPKWLESHAYELAYYIATNGANRAIDVAAIRQAGFIEGCNISDADRDILTRHGAIKPRADAPPTEQPTYLTINGARYMRIDDIARITLATPPAEKGEG